MIPIYHDIVGRGMVMELAFAIDRDGLVEKSHEAVYKQLGKWVENCYGTPVLSKQNTIGERRIHLRLSPQRPAGSSGFRSFDRIVLREDVAVGQRIRNYTIDLVYDNDGDNTRPEEVITTLVSNGTSVGRKRIHLLGEQYDYYYDPSEPMRNRSVVLTITEEIGPPHLSMFGLYEPCYPES
jgi:hypothetical protein